MSTGRMNIKVEYKDPTGKITNQTISLTRLAFIKHLAIAGQGYAPRPQKLLRTIAMCFHYNYYFQKEAFYKNKFSTPPIKLSDPTEKGQFSNLAGKAIADFLSKKIDNSLFTVNYEAAMRMSGMPIIGERPDLLAFNPNAMFSIESKGHSGGAGNMIKHKKQSLSGGIKVNFTVACVSYYLYTDVKCKYHDPFNRDIPYDNKLLQGLTKNYYKGLSEFLDKNFFEYSEFEIQGEKFYEIKLSNRFGEKILTGDFPFGQIWYFEFLELYSPRLVLPVKILEYVEKGIDRETIPFVFKTEEQENNLYIDNDRVGLRIRG